MCMSPNQVYWDMIEKKWSFKWNHNCDPFRNMIVPCGKCPECKKKWRTQLAQRVRYEMDKYDKRTELCFLTLTVNDDYIDEVFPDGSLNHVYFQKFMKRLRRHLEYHGFTKKIKYLCCGEYGEKNGRPHFHVILFGWKPAEKDMIYRGRSKKGYPAYKCPMLEKIWKAGFVDIGEVTEHSAPYMVKYMVKFSEIKSDDFEVNGKKVRKPYIVYPKTILGIDYFIQNYKQILKLGYIYDSRGKIHGIPRSFLKYAENSDNIEMQELYKFYKDRVKLYLIEETRRLVSEGYYYPEDRYRYYVEQGRIRRIIYEQMKNKNR